METKIKPFSLKHVIGEVKNTIVESKLKAQEFFNKLNVHSLLAFAGIIGPLMLTVGDLVAVRP